MIDSHHDMPTGAANQGAYGRFDGNRAASLFRRCSQKGVQKNKFPPYTFYATKMRASPRGESNETGRSGAILCGHLPHGRPKSRPREAQIRGMACEEHKCGERSGTPPLSARLAPQYRRGSIPAGRQRCARRYGSARLGLSANINARTVASHSHQPSMFEVAPAPCGKLSVHTDRLRVGSYRAQRMGGCRVLNHRYGRARCPAGWSVLLCSTLSDSFGVYNYH